MPVVGGVPSFVVPLGVPAGDNIEADIFWQPASVKGNIMSSSMISCNFFGMRVAGSLSYYPGYMKKDGTHVDQRVLVPAYANIYAPGEKGSESDPYTFIMWGRMAETLCRNLSPGREINVANAVSKPWRKKQKHSNGMPALDMVTGAPLETKETNYQVDPGCLTFYDREATKFIEQQKQTGYRPLQWENATHPDSKVWSDIKITRNSEIWNGTSEEFGYAKVFIPTGDNVDKIDKMLPKAARTARDVALATAPAPAPAPAAPALDMLAVMIKEAVKAALSSTPSPSPFNSDYAAMGEPKSLFTEILSQLPADSPEPPAPPAPQTEDVNLF